jgi:NADH:ubiquinone oxidoreductase subunit 6 (subunit J)
MYSVFGSLTIIGFSAFCLFLLKVEFLTLVYVIVYVGAVIVLFLFVIFSTDLRKEDTWVKIRLIYEYKVGTFLLFLLFSSIVVVSFDVIAAQQQVLTFYLAGKRVKILAISVGGLFLRIKEYFQPTYKILIDVWAFLSCYVLP